jgi:hypothetical protein
MVYISFIGKPMYYSIFFTTTCVRLYITKY